MEEPIVAMPMTESMGARNDDPRKLRELLSRSAALASDHGVGSVVVGMAAAEGDLDFPDFVDFVESELRVEDGLFRMTRERAIACLADVDLETAREVMERVLAGFCQQGTHRQAREYRLAYLGVEPGTSVLSVKDVLPALFGATAESASS